MAAHTQGANPDAPRRLADQATEVLRGVPLFAVLGEDGLTAASRAVERAPSGAPGTGPARTFAGAIRNRQV